MKEKTIIIVGGGQAAAMAAASLRQQGFTGELHLFSDEQPARQLDRCRCLMHWENAALPYAMPVMPPDCEKFCSPNGQS